MRTTARLIFVAGTLAAVAACAPNPPKPATPAAEQVSSQAVKDAGLTGDKIVALQHAGYKIVDQNGQKLYCSTDPKTGSRIQKDNTCLTEKELIALREETRRSMQNMAREIAPPAGK